MAKTIGTMIGELIEREGGYVNHPADRGGPTRWGITETVARMQGYQGDMRYLSKGEASEIYRRIYWLAPRFEAVAERAPMLAEELFDTGINMGVGVATDFLQRALNALNRNGADYDDLSRDRKVGPATLKALDAFIGKRGRKNGEAVLIKAVEALQGARYLEIAEARQSQEAFVYGWLASRIGNTNEGVKI